MSFVIRQLRGSGLSETMADIVINRSEITIGRGADRDILINEPRVSWEHARIVQTADDEYRLDVQTDSGIVFLNGVPVHGGKLKSGDLIEIAGVQIQFQLSDGRSYLAVSKAPRKKENYFQELRAHSKLTLQELAVSKRKWSWSLFLGVLVVALAMPLLVRTSPALYENFKQWHIPSDDLWNSGPVASAHQGFGADCADCHIKLFQRVPDMACVDCHKKVSHHADNEELIQASHFEQYRCADCHQEHNGDAGLVMAHPAICTDCHADPVSDMPNSQLLAVSDFANAHPEFSPQRWIETADGARSDASIPIDDGRQEDAALIYPHDLHLVAEGLEDSEGNVRVLQCESCHEYAPGQVQFKPIRFQRHCQSCHSLAFDPDAKQEQVPHGSTQAVLEYLRGFYARQVLEGAPDIPVTAVASPRGRVRSVSADRDAGRNTLLAKAEGRARDAIDETIRVRLCAKCHLIDLAAEPGSEADWRVKPFQQRAVWMTAARFDHSSHKTESCDSCHTGVYQSADADDVLMPEIAHCRDCHGGAHATPPKLKSLCVDCHGFHISESRLMTVDESKADIAKIVPNDKIDVLDDAEEQQVESLVKSLKVR